MAKKKDEKLEEEITADPSVQTTTEDPVESAPVSAPQSTPNVMDLPGVGAATAEKLASAGFEDLMSVAVATPSELANASGVSEAVSRKMIHAARDALDMGFISGIDLLKKRETVNRISTGSLAFDQMLDGGFETGAITECFGQYGSGKTQVSHALAVNCQINDPDAVAVYIDTENTFRPERIAQFARGQGLNPERVLENVKVARAFNSDHQMLLAEKVGDLVNQGIKVRVVIIDSLTAHFRAEFIGRGTLAERQQKINKHMRVLAKLADMHNLCIYVTNQVMAKPDAFFGDPTEAIGGNIVGHNSTFRIYLRRGKKGTRVAKLIDAPNLADAECVFMITEDKLADV